jgi:hypothetical protein
MWKGEGIRVGEHVTHKMKEPLNLAVKWFEGAKVVVRRIGSSLSLNSPHLERAEVVRLYDN